VDDSPRRDSTPMLLQIAEVKLLVIGSCDSIVLNATPVMSQAPMRFYARQVENVDLVFMQEPRRAAAAMQVLH